MLDKKLSLYVFVCWAICLFLVNSLTSFAEPSSTALPQGEQVIHGEVNFRTSPASLTGGAYKAILSVNANTNRSIVNYQSFNIGRDSVVNFNLPNASSVILNRVVGGNVSKIFGAINSNGRVFLVNPSGILFGSSSRVNVNSLFASTLDIHDNDFLNDNFVFQNPPAPLTGGAIVNKGKLNGTELIALFGGALINDGEITSPNVQLAVGDKISFTQNSGLNFEVTVDEPLKVAVQGATSAIQNNGSIQGALIQLQARLDDAIYTNSVNNTGIIEASSMGDLSLNPPAPLTGVAQNNVVISTNQDVINSGVSKGNDIFIEAKTLENTGLIKATEDVVIVTSGTKSITRANPDQTIIHSNIGSRDQNFRTRTHSELVQNIIISTYNHSGGTIEAGRDLSILTDSLYNTSANLIAGRDFNFIGRRLVNERTGFYTQYLPKRWGIEGYSLIPGYIEKSNHYDKYEYWLDRTPTQQPGYVGVGRDLNILADSFNNQNSLVEVGNDFSFSGKTFDIGAKVLQGTQLHIWRSQEQRRYYEPSRAIPGNFSTVSVGGDFNAELTGDFKLTNGGRLSAQGDINVKARNFTAGSTNPNINTPPAIVIPTSFGLSWTAIPSDVLDELRLGFEYLSEESISAIGRELRNTIFNLTGQSTLSGKPSLDGGLSILIEAAQKAMNKDTSLVYGEPLTEAQIANLEEPILWFDGEKLLVYVPKVDRRSTSPEGLIQASNINFDIENTFHNTGSVIASGKLKIKADEVINEQRLATFGKHYRVGGGLFGGGKSKLFHSTELQDGGNLFASEIEIAGVSRDGVGAPSFSAQNFRNIGGTIASAGDLKINAENITTEGQLAQGIGYSTSRKGLMNTTTIYSISNYEQGELIAGGNLLLTGGKKILAEGSNLIAGEKISIRAPEIEIKAGEFQDWMQSWTSGFDIGWRGKTSAGVTYVDSKTTSEWTRLVPSNLLAENIELINPPTPLTGGDQSPSINGKIIVDASNLTASESISFKTLNLSVSGEFAPYNSTTKTITVGINADPIMGGAAFTGGYTNSKTKGATYQEASINAPKVSLNGGEYKGVGAEGLSLNGQEINPQSESEESQSYGFGGSLGTGGFTVSASVDDFSIFGGLSWTGAPTVGAGYQDWFVSGTFGNGSQVVAIGNSMFGSVGLSTSDRISSHHRIWSLDTNILGFDNHLNFQHGDLRSVSGGFGAFFRFDEVVQPFDLVCFEEDTPVEMNQGTKKIQEIKIGDTVRTWDESSKSFNWKKVTNFFERTANSTIHLKLSNSELMKVTPEHVILVNGVWKRAGEIKVSDKLLGSSGVEIEVIDLERVNNQVKVYNFEVEDTHTYIAHGVVVHNDCIRSANGELRNEPSTYKLKSGEMKLSLDDIDGTVKLNGKMLLDGQEFKITDNKVFDSRGHRLTPEEIYQVSEINGFNLFDIKQEQALFLTLSYKDLENLAVKHIGESGNQYVLNAMSQKALSNEQRSIIANLYEQNREVQFMDTQDNVTYGVAGVLASGGGSVYQGQAKSNYLFNNLNIVKASDLIELAKSNGWTLRQNPSGPIRYFDQNGINRLTIKRGSVNAPGSNYPHVEMRNSLGLRYDPYSPQSGNVSRKSIENHRPIIWDLDN